MQTIVSISFFKYRYINQLWALPQMKFAYDEIKRQKGNQFHKMLGTGGGKGFSIIPDFSIYALLIVWDNMVNAHTFFDNAEVFKNFKDHAYEHWTILMIPLKSHGKWSGINPFAADPNISLGNKPLAVITRASINRRKFWHFWRSVPSVNKEISHQQDLLFTKGIGELPFVEQGTFSIWKNKEAMIKFAYQSPAHKQAIKKTKKLEWYDEELFAQFVPVESFGLWKGIDPLCK